MNQNKEFMQRRVRGILAGMRAGTFERDEALALSLLSSLAGESIFLLGLPGVGKSMMARRLKLAFSDARVFEYLMSRFSTPDEIFGPVSISRLKDDDCYERVTSGYLPEAEVVFLDEIWKAGPAIQNSLLTVLNEKIYLNGNREMSLPLKAIIAASNELPAKDEGLEALWDRFLIRYVVEPISGKENFLRLLTGTSVASHDEEFVPLSAEEYQAVRDASAHVSVPDAILEVIYDIRLRLNAKVDEKDDGGEPSPENLKYYVSDRRWKKCLGVMRTSAFLNGRGEVDMSDLLLLCHMLWNEESTISEVRAIVCESAVAARFSDILERYKSFKRHAAKKGQPRRPKLYSPDCRHYVILCGESPLKIAIDDYRTICDNRTEMFFGSETTDGTLVIRKRGQFVIRYVSDGCLDINGYNYFLRTESDNELGREFIKEMGESVESIADSFYLAMKRNIFVASSSIHRSVRDVVEVYSKRFESV